MPLVAESSRMVRTVNFRRSGRTFALHRCRGYQFFFSRMRVCANVQCGFMTVVSVLRLSTSATCFDVLHLVHVGLRDSGLFFHPRCAPIVLMGEGGPNCLHKRCGLVVKCCVVFFLGERRHGTFTHAAPWKRLAVERNFHARALHSH